MLLLFYMNGWSFTSSPSHNLQQNEWRHPIHHCAISFCIAQASTAVHCPCAQSAPYRVWRPGLGCGDEQFLRLVYMYRVHPLVVSCAGLKSSETTAAWWHVAVLYSALAHTDTGSRTAVPCIFTDVDSCAVRMRTNVSVRTAVLASWLWSSPPGTRCALHFTDVYGCTVPMRTNVSIRTAVLAVSLDCGGLLLGLVVPCIFTDVYGCALRMRTNVSVRTAVLAVSLDCGGLLQGLVVLLHNVEVVPVAAPHGQHSQVLHHNAEQHNVR